MNVPADRPLASWIAELATAGKLYAFYKTPEWLALRGDVMRDHNGECEMCAARGEYSPARTVHHEYEVKRFPSMALTRWVEAPGGERREVLHPLCNRCHNEVHDRCNGGHVPVKKLKPVTAERCD